LKGAYGEYHQFVNRITNDDALNGNRDFWLLAGERLAPNFAEHKILGLTYENRHFLFDIEAYHKNLEGVAEFSQRFHRPPGSPAEELFFLGDGAAQGIEFMAQKKIGKLNGWASYTLAEVEYRIPELNGGEAFPAKQDRRHEVKLVGNYCLAKWNFAATWVLNSGAPYTAPVSGGAGMLGDKNANRLPAYHRFDISCSRQFTFTDLNWEVGLSIFNLYDRRNVLRREFVLNANSVSVRDLTTLGLTPTVTLRVNLK
ncbi:MAG TPA: TonB-dependent receptor, partial [bacterium]